MNGVNVPIDIDGYVLDGQAAPEGSPVIIESRPAARAQRRRPRSTRARSSSPPAGARVPNAAFGRTVLALVYRQNAGLTAVLSGVGRSTATPLWVTFGDSRDYDYKVAALYVLLEQARQKDLTLNTVDLRFGDRLSFN